MCVWTAAIINTLSEQQGDVVQPSLLQRWAVVRAQELSQVWHVLARAVELRSLSSDIQLPYSALWTVFCTSILAVGLVTGIGRRGVQTVVALLLLLALMGVVLGLPLGKNKAALMHFWQPLQQAVQALLLYFADSALLSGNLTMSVPGHSLCCTDLDTHDCR